MTPSLRRSGVPHTPKNFLGVAGSGDSVWSLLRPEHNWASLEDGRREEPGLLEGADAGRAGGFGTFEGVTYAAVPLWTSVMELSVLLTSTFVQVYCD